MRGLAFPPNAVVDRETSYEYGTPVSNVDDIPIDPALGEAAIDPALMANDQSATIVHDQHPPMPEHHYPQDQPPPSHEYQIRQYSQGPQGDPFAPPIPFFPPVFEQVQPRPPPQKAKRKRNKVHKEEECSFCQGKEHNKHGQIEALLTCHECGRSGHPSCMALEKLGDVVRPWKCIECKNCEVCQEKGDDERILFCDWCDRGWHMDCMEPPLETPPEGEWHCPVCPPISTEDAPLEYLGEQEVVPIPMESVRESSVASSSRSAIEVQVEPTPTKAKRSRKSIGKKKMKTPKATVSGSDDDEDDVEETPVVLPRPRGRPKGSVRKVQPPPPISSDDDHEVLSAPTTRRKRPRPSSPTPVSRVVRLRIPPQRGKGKEREEEEPAHGIFDDFLNPEERDTSKTTPLNLDKQIFERSRMMAEEKLAPPPPPPPTGSSSRTTNGTENSTPAHSRPLRSATLQHISTPRLVDLANSPGPSTPGGPPSLPKLEPGVLRIRSIRFGPYDIKTWYDAPFPEEYASIPDGRLWICEFCLKYMKSRFMAVRHLMKCKVRHPPGDEIYRDGIVSIFEVDGRRNKIYCQNLCLLSKMFLDHKSLFYDVEPFLFYVITQVDDLGARFVGYFSKEKRCPKDYNLSCIMTLPVRQRQGWGNLLMDFSYLLSKIEQRLGSPEKPLSSLGALGYKNYWTLAIMRFLEKAPDNVRLEDISSATSMTIEDVCNTLIHLNMIFIRESTPPPIRPSPGQSIKFPKGRKNGVARKALQKMQAQEKDSDGNKAPFVPPKNYEIHFDRQKVDAYLKAWEAKGYLKLKPEKLQWTPYLVSRTTQEAAVTVDLPSRDNVPDGSSKAESTVPELSTEPATPAPMNGIKADSPHSEVQEDERPMVIDSVSPEPKTKTRSSVKSTSEERPQRVTRALSLPSSPPLQAQSTTGLRTRSSHMNLPSPSPALSGVGPSTSGRSTRRNNKGRKKVEEDEALPAQLAVVETPSARTLRSGRGDTQAEEKRPASRTIIPRVRKRRRIESSPENEELPKGEVGSKGPLNDETNDEATLVTTIDCDIPPGSPPKVNGNHNGHVEGAGCNGTTLAYETMTPEDSAQTTATAEEEAVAMEVLGRGETEVKSEDRGTPLTNVTGGQSVPSDDTVFLTESQHGKYGEYQGAVHAESDLRSTLGAGSVMMNLDDCHDEDADGEYEDEEDDVVC